MDELGVIVRFLPVLKDGAFDVAVHKILQHGGVAEQSDLDRPADVEGVAVRLVLRELTEPLCQHDGKALLLSAEEGVDVHAQNLGELRQDLGVGRSAALPARHRLRRHADELTELLLGDAAFHAVFFDLLSDNAHSIKPPLIDTSILTKKTAVCL